MAAISGSGDDRDPGVAFASSGVPGDDDQGVDDGEDLNQKETSRGGVGVLRFFGPVLRVALTLLLLALGFHVVGTFVSSSTHT